MLLGHEGGRRPSRRDRLVFAAERLVETAQEGGVEAGGEHRARQVEHVGDAVEPDIGKRRDGLRVEAERRERERRKRVPHCAGRDDEEMLVLVIPGAGARPRARNPYSPTGVMDSGPRPSGSPGITGIVLQNPYRATPQAQPGVLGDRHARAQTLGGEARHDIAAKRRLSAEQMRAAGDVEHDRQRGHRSRPAGYSGRTNRRPRRAAAGPPRDRFARPAAWDDGARAHRRAPCRP